MDLFLKTNRSFILTIRWVLKYPSIRILREKKGFSIIEAAFVILIGGLVLGMAAMSWHSMLETKRLSVANAELEAANNCLINYALHSEKIPSTNYFDTFCKKVDPWGESIIYINSADDEPIAPGMASLALNMDGINKNHIAWVLISKGSNKSLECSLGSGTVTCTNGDDIYSYVSVEKLYEQKSRI